MKQRIWYIPVTLLMIGMVGTSCALNRSGKRRIHEILSRKRLNSGQAPAEHPQVEQSQVEQSQIEQSQIEQSQIEQSQIVAQTTQKEWVQGQEEAIKEGSANFEVTVLASAEPLNEMAKQLDEYAKLSYLELREKGSEISDLQIDMLKMIVNTENCASDEEIRRASESLKNYREHFAKELEAFKK